MNSVKEKQNIPQGWKENNLLDCFLVPSKLAGVKQSQYEKSGDFPVFDQGQDYISGYSSDKKLLIENVPAILFGDHTRIVKYIKSPFVAGADGTKIFWAKDGYDSSFLYYLVSNQNIPNTGYNRHFKFLKDIEVIVPESKPEQQKIAEILGAVDEDIAKTQEVIEATEKLKRGLMQQLFTRGIGHTKFKNVRLEEVSKISTGTTPSTNKQEYYEGENPFIKTGEIVNEKITRAEVYISDQAVKDYRLKKYQPGTILVAMYGQGKTRGQTALLEIEACTTQNAAAIEPSKDINATYLWFFLKSQYELLRGGGVQGHISHLNLSYMKNYQIPLPLMSEQKEIAEILSAIDEKISVNKKLKEKLTILKKGLMQDLLSGKVRTK